MLHNDFSCDHRPNLSQNHTMMMMMMIMMKVTIIIIKNYNKDDDNESAFAKFSSIYSPEQPRTLLAFERLERFERQRDHLKFTYTLLPTAKMQNSYQIHNYKQKNFIGMFLNNQPKS
ncbi:unnamed protein product [Meganyctiphanes norvegica]|uniref:Uncharacterized protein n=1 Tax=Meganyctiphanes norvegica TaxID=48144 RepID=A0AAV2SGM3_MEGNR